MKNSALEPIDLGPIEGLATPLAADEVERTVVLLHGYGAPGTDLAGLTGHIDAPERTRFVFPAAPLLLEPAAGPLSGRAWWHLDMVQLQMARFTGQVDQIANWHPEGLEESREQLAAALEVLKTDHGMDPARTFLGGFSQGAMLSLDWALRSEEPLAGSVVLSGTIICADEWPPLMKKRSGLPVFQSHSPDDPVLPYSLAERLAQLMKDAGWKHSFVSFAGGHGVAPEVVAGLSRFLTSG